MSSFDQMFEGIRQALISVSQSAINDAERNIDNKLAIKVLKALFLVKYIDGFSATAKNLTVLVYDKFGLDLPQLTKDVQEALNLLEAQTYIQRNGNVYEYLSNDEKKIEEEIKNVEVHGSEISKKLYEIISTEVIKTSKIRYDKNNQDFAFGFKLDDQPQGMQKDLTINFISPSYDFNEDEIRMHSAGKDELRVVMARNDDRLRSDLMAVLQTEKYTKLKRSGNISPAEDRILTSKAAFNNERNKELIERVRKINRRSSRSCKTLQK
ncbi:MAG: hypothetical protein V9G25_09405 [Acidimicrobiia bacterium]